MAAHYVTLTWNASVSSGVVGYNIYRGTAPGKEGAAPINPSPVAGTTYTDNNVTAGQVYDYWVTAVASTGQESVHSSEVAVTVPFSPPEPPTGLAAVAY